VIGDLDSLFPEDIDQLTRMGVPLERYPVDKDETDLELTINWALRNGFDQLFIAGALGGRFDQSLGNLFLLSRPELAGKDVRLEDGTEQVFLLPRNGVITGQVGDTVSLIPLGEPVEGVNTVGLKYPLGKNGVGETLYADRTRGISNVLLAERAAVRFTKGTLICILRRKEK
jgi:thiamine pyrophosphokinase